jgi:hypothetical protein
MRSLKLQAQTALGNARRRGKLIPGPCEVCGTEKVVGHHYLGYEKENWFKVQWLCGMHHYEAHFATIPGRLKRRIVDHLYSETITNEQLKTIYELIIQQQTNEYEHLSPH